SFCDRLVLFKLLDQDMRLRRIAAAEDRLIGAINKADLILVLPCSSEIKMIALIHQRKDATADRNARSAGVAGLFPCLAKGADLLGLLDVKGLAGFIELKRRGLQIHS